MLNFDNPASELIFLSNHPYSHIAISFPNKGVEYAHTPRLILTIFRGTHFDCVLNETLEGSDAAENPIRLLSNGHFYQAEFS